VQYKPWENIWVQSHDDFKPNYRRRQWRHPDYAKEKPDGPNNQQQDSKRVLLIASHAADILTPLAALQGLQSPTHDALKLPLQESN
jgi:hypothetical protein